MNAVLTMNSSVFVVLAVIGVGLSAGCGFAYKEEINDKYAIIAIDTPDRMAVGRRSKTGKSYVARITATVARVGWSKTTIYAEKTDGTFWVLFTEKDSDQVSSAAVTRGPLTEVQLAKILKARGIPHIEFAWTNPHLCRGSAELKRTRP